MAAAGFQAGHDQHAVVVRRADFLVAVMGDERVRRGNDFAAAIGMGKGEAVGSSGDRVRHLRKSAGRVDHRPSGHAGMAQQSSNGGTGLAQGRWLPMLAGFDENPRRASGGLGDMAVIN